MATVQKHAARSEAVRKLLEKKTGFALTYGNWIIILFIFFGILASKELKYPEYKRYDIIVDTKGISDNNATSEFIIKIPLSDDQLYCFKTDVTDVYFDNGNQVLEIGVLGNKVDMIGAENLYVLDRSTGKQLVDFDITTKSALIKVGETSLFHQFYSQFDRNISPLKGF